MSEKGGDGYHIGQEGGLAAGRAWSAENGGNSKGNIQQSGQEK